MLKRLKAYFNVIERVKTKRKERRREKEEEGGGWRKEGEDQNKKRKVEGEGGREVVIKEKIHGYRKTLFSPPNHSQYTHK